MNYTKGPWEISEKFNSDTSSESGMCSVYAPNGEWYVCTVEDTANWDGDARLISAAPDLYEALKQLCSQVNDLDLCSAPAYALAAIAKAEGRSND